MKKGLGVLMGQGYSGWEHYWRKYPREVCPQCKKKTYIQPSKAEIWHDGEWEVREVNGKLERFLPKRCYHCGYKEGQPLEYSVERTKTGRFTIAERYGRYDGEVIWKTKDCSKCPAKRRILIVGESPNNFVGLCSKGIAWKVIVHRKDKAPRKCNKNQKGKEQDR